MASSKPLLYNFHPHTLPEGIPELLDLLGFFHFWDTSAMKHRIYEKLAAAPRMKWKMMEFKGGTTAEWQRFLSTITAPEHVR
jgi:hypothetical protein